MLDASGLETCQFVNAKERGCPQGGKAGSKWREDVILQTTVGGSGAYGRLWRIGHGEVDGLRLEITVTVNSVGRM